MAESIAAQPAVTLSVDLSGDNTLALSCRAAARLDVSGLDSVHRALDWCAREGLAPLPLGEGSNVILPERLSSAVLRNVDTRLVELERDADTVLLRVGGGRNWHRTVADCLRSGCFGLENLALIPGSVGAAPVQNIGAYGVELAPYVEAVHTVTLRDGQPLSLSRDACRFAYRHSVFKGELRGRCMILALDLRLSRRPAPCLAYPALADRLAASALEVTPESVFEAVVALRRERLPDPAQFPNAGSFFKNPLVCDAQAQALRKRYPALPAHRVEDGRYKLSAAWMIEHCGLRGRRLGTAGVAERHALVLVNHGGGRGDLLRLAAQIQREVQRRFHCALEFEPQMIGDE